MTDTDPAVLALEHTIAVAIVRSKVSAAGAEGVLSRLLRAQIVLAEREKQHTARLAREARDESKVYGWCPDCTGPLPGCCVCGPAHRHQDVPPQPVPCPMPLPAGAFPYPDGSNAKESGEPSPVVAAASARAAWERMNFPPIAVAANGEPVNLLNGKTVCRKCGWDWPVCTCAFLRTAPEPEPEHVSKPDALACPPNPAEQHRLGPFDFPLKDSGPFLSGGAPHYAPPDRKPCGHRWIDCCACGAERTDG